MFYMLLSQSDLVLNQNLAMILTKVYGSLTKSTRNLKMFLF